MFDNNNNTHQLEMYDNQLEYHNGVAIVKKNGKFGAIMVGGKEIIPPIYDDLSTFEDGYATVKYKGAERTVNLSGQIQVKCGEESVFLSEEYDWGYDFIGDVCIVAKKYLDGFLYGIVSCKKDKTILNRIDLNDSVVKTRPIEKDRTTASVRNRPMRLIETELLLPCEYDYICEYTNFDFGFLPFETPSGFSECKNFKGFVMRKHGSYGLVDFNGNIIAETKYDNINTIKDKYFQLTIKKWYPDPKKLFCIIDECGNPLTPEDCEKITLASIDDVDYWIVSRDNLEGVYCNNNEFIPVYFKEIIPHSDSFECIIGHTNEKVTYNSKGQVILNYVGRHIVFPSDYSIILESSIIGLFRVSKGNKWGIVNSKNEWVVPNNFLFIEPFQNGFAKIVEEVPEKTAWSSRKLSGSAKYENAQWGLVDTTGEVVLPPKYDSLEFENGIWIIGENRKYGLLSPSLSEIVSPKYNEIEYIGNNYFKVNYYNDIDNYRTIGLIDITGKEIFQSGSFDPSDTIELFGEHTFKVTTLTSFPNINSITIIDQRGKIIAELDEGGDIFYQNDGLMTLTDHYGLKRLVNMQGKNIFERGFTDIIVRDNGLISLYEKEHGWGVGTIDGEIIIDTIYPNEILFENDTAPVQVSSAEFEQKINRKGLVIVHNGETEITLSKGVYWMTDFVNGISIVKQSFNYYNRIGVINQKGNEIIPPKYSEVRLLSDNTIQVVVGELNGLFDINGNVIFPPIFTVIKRIAKDRIQVQWNPQRAKEWDNTGYVSEPSDEKKTNIIGEFRSTLCNSKGEVVCDKGYLIVGKFTYYGALDKMYALAYKEIYMDNYRIRYRQVGVIDITGKTVVEPIYDSIIFYEEIQYARLKKDGKFGIVHLQSGKECSIIINCEYDSISIFRNGMIKVANSNGDTQLFGLFDLNGKELLPVKYRTIVCDNGIVTAEDQEGNRKYVHTFEIDGIQEYTEYSLYKYNDYYPEAPNVVIYGTIPKSRDSYYEPYNYYSDYDDDDGGGYSKYGGYNGYDDFTIDEAFEGNPGLTWNID